MFTVGEGLAEVVVVVEVAVVVQDVVAGLVDEMVEVVALDEVDDVILVFVLAVVVVHGYLNQ